MRNTIFANLFVFALYFSVLIVYNGANSLFHLGLGFIGFSMGAAIMVVA